MIRGRHNYKDIGRKDNSKNLPSNTKSLVGESSKIEREDTTLASGSNNNQQ